MTKQTEIDIMELASRATTCWVVETNATWWNLLRLKLASRLMELGAWVGGFASAELEIRWTDDKAQKPNLV